jgi:hypothetical protein
MLWPGEFRQEMFAELSFCFNSVLVLSELSLIDWNVVSRGLVGLPSTIFATVTFPVTVFSSTATSRNPLSSYFSESTVMVFFPLAFSLSWDWDESAYCDASINSIRSGLEQGRRDKADGGHQYQNTQQRVHEPRGALLVVVGRVRAFVVFGVVSHSEVSLVLWRFEF